MMNSKTSLNHERNDIMTSSHFVPAEQLEHYKPVFEQCKCRICDDEIDPARWEIGKRVCLECGEEQSRQERMSWCVVPMHKSNYFFCTDRADLKGINNKGGLVK